MSRSIPRRVVSWSMPSSDFELTTGPNSCTSTVEGHWAGRRGPDPAKRGRQRGDHQAVAGALRPEPQPMSDRSDSRSSRGAATTAGTRSIGRPDPTHRDRRAAGALCGAKPLLGERTTANHEAGNNCREDARDYDGAATEDVSRRCCNYEGLGVAIYLD